MKRMAVQGERTVNDAGTLAYICRVPLALPASQSVGIVARPALDDRANRLERMAPAPGLSASARFLRGRVRTGLVRSRNSLVPAIQMTACAVGAYAFAEYVLGHSGPLFAATSSLIALGFSRDPRLRRVIEVGLGCTHRHRGRGPAAALAGLRNLAGRRRAPVLHPAGPVPGQRDDLHHPAGPAVGAGGAPARAGRGAVHPQHRRRRGRGVRPADDHPVPEGPAAGTPQRRQEAPARARRGAARMRLAR